MKIRQGFVSNSSSSSFIITVEPSIVTPKAIYDIMKEKVFDGDDVLVTDYQGDMHADHVADLLYGEIKDSLDRMHDNPIEYDEQLIDQLVKSLTPYDEWNKIWSKYYSIVRLDEPVDDDQHHQAYMGEWVDYTEKKRVEAKETMRKMREMNPGKILISITFADGDGRGFGWLEHSGAIGKIFKGPIVINNH